MLVQFPVHVCFKTIRGLRMTPPHALLALRIPGPAAVYTSERE